MERYKNKKVLVVGVGKTGFSLIHFFNTLNCEVRVTDIKPIFDLNKQVKKLKRMEPAPHMTFGEHRAEDFIEADIIVYSSSVNPNLEQLQKAREAGRDVMSEFELSVRLCTKPIIAVCSSYGRTAVAHMIGFCLRQDGKNVFVCGGSVPFIDFYMQPGKDELDYVVVEVSSTQMQSCSRFHPKLVVFGNIGDRFQEGRFRTVGDYIETKVGVIKNLSPDDFLIVNFDALYNNAIFRNANCQVCWYSRKSFVKQGVMNDVQGTHFHEKRIHSNIHYHSDFKVTSMRIIGQENRENLLAAITACKALQVKDTSIQATIEKFPGIPHSLEFVMEKNGVKFYNDSKSEKMTELVATLEAFKEPVILIAGGKDNDEDYEPYANEVIRNTRLVVLVGECKERFNRVLGDRCEVFLVGSFEESVLIAYQKSRTGDTILLSPGNLSTDIFRDYEERGNYFRKLVYQL